MEISAARAGGLLTRARATGDKVGEELALQMLAEARIGNRIREVQRSGHLTREAAARLCALLMESAVAA